MSCANEDMGKYLHPSTVVYQFIKRIEAKLNAEQATANRHLASIKDLQMLLLKAQSPVDVEVIEIQFSEVIPRYAAALCQLRDTLMTLDPEEITQMMIDAGISEEKARRWVGRVAPRLLDMFSCYRQHSPDRIAKRFAQAFVRFKQLTRSLQKAKVGKSMAGQSAKELAVPEMVKQPLVAVIKGDEEVEKGGNVN
ncbi:hypothetical protein M011DRAFT_477820 [Sporormia fimetaria CBS 119925]|uniref:Uncharacterized protein n=1 Tax=Sporormia fimetaria CBS 119925 TaxID=1340428 RepID=A0A6A6VCS8_9PLEO|nr:hypothetical protein M011DRAFT_477820 [Sporormia fimetaria CBS 119925]